MTASTDAVALLAAITAQPDEDTPRLVYADWLQEFGEPDRAEFIRVQASLASELVPEGWEDTEAVLKSRESALLTAHPDWFRAKCPTGCDEGREWQFSGHGTRPACPTCSGTGYIPVTPRRGFAYSCAATMGQLFERPRYQCEECGDPGPNLMRDSCPKCGCMTLIDGDYRPTEWLLDLLRAYPAMEEVRVADREPSLFGLRWTWLSYDGEDTTSFIPGILYDSGAGDTYETSDAAHTALARSVVAVARKWLAGSVSSPAA